jgi:hypothetical protein
MPKYFATYKQSDIPLQFRGLFCFHFFFLGYITTILKSSGSCFLFLFLNVFVNVLRSPQWSSGQISLLLTQRSRVRFPELPNFLSSHIDKQRNRKCKQRKNLHSRYIKLVEVSCMWKNVWILRYDVLHVQNKGNRSFVSLTFNSCHHWE